MNIEHVKSLLYRSVSDPRSKALLMAIEALEHELRLAKEAHDSQTTYRLSWSLSSIARQFPSFPNE